MKNIKKLTLAYFASLLVFGGAAWARQPDVRHEDIVVAKGETLNGDVATEKSILVDGKLIGDAAAVGGGSVTVNGELTGDLVSMGGPVSVAGIVRGDLSSIGGPVNITGRITGNVSAVGGKVTLAGQARVDGDISALGGVEKGPQAVHNGSVNVFTPAGLKMPVGKALSTLRALGVNPGAPAMPRWERRSSAWNWNLRLDNLDTSDMGKVAGLVAAFAAVMFFVMASGVLLVTLPAIFFPVNVERSLAAISLDIWKSCAIGALMLVCLAPGLLMMVVSILGIPLVPFALILFAAAGVLGLSAFCVIVQARFFEGIKRQGPAGLPGKAAAGAALIAGLLFFGKMVPLVGGVLSLVGMILLAFGTMIGLGAAWMTRMGTRPYIAPAYPAAPAAVPAAAPAAQPPAVPPAQQ